MSTEEKEGETCWAIEGSRTNEWDPGSVEGYPTAGVPPVPHPEAIKKLIVASWEDIDFEYEGLTDTEKECLTFEQHRDIVEWLKG